MDGQNEDAVQSSSPKVVSHGFMRVLNRPAQWLIIIALLVSWSAAGIFMFDFVSDTQLTNLQDIGSDPITAVNKAVEGIADRMSHMNDIFSDAQEYVPNVISDPMGTAVQWTDTSVTFLSGILGSGNEGVTGVFKLGTDALDEVNDWVRAPVGHLFHMFEDTLNAVIVQPLEMVGEGATFISDVAVAVSNSVSGLFKGIGAWIPAMSTSPMDLANNVLEGAGNLKNTVFTTVSNLFAGDEGGIPDINFDPMKVVTDTVEEFADRRDMFLAYLSNILMEDKEEAPHVIRRKGEFLPPLEKVLEQERIAKEKKAREEVFKVLQELRAEKAKKEEKEKVERDKKKEKEKEEVMKEKAKLKEKPEEDISVFLKPKEPVINEDRINATVKEHELVKEKPTASHKDIKVTKEKAEAVSVKKEPEPAPKEKVKPESAPKEKVKPEPAPKEKVKPESAPKEKVKPEAAPKEKAKPEPAPKEKAKPETVPKEKAKPEPAPKEKVKT
ncbi:microtubule-associated protein 1B [Colossoma macropomum]|uniref:microtubule-associated protein 1B n=1 Tax=Colossoma macropomum TaxID=42526 RepID=UPI001863C88D|nr:microtubule-associated protein 1B [Colossoma macropomum]